jgi:hypothetical protein
VRNLTEDFKFELSVSIFVVVAFSRLVANHINFPILIVIDFITIITPIRNHISGKTINGNIRW